MILINSCYHLQINNKNNITNQKTIIIKVIIIRRSRRDGKRIEKITQRNCSKNWIREKVNGG